MGGWAAAQSPILVTTITLDRLCKRGYESMLNITRKLLHIFMNRCTRDPYVQWCERLSPSGYLVGRSTRLYAVFFFPNNLEFDRSCKCPP